MALQAQRAGQHRRRTGHVHVVEVVVLDDHDPPAVGLEDVGFVDPDLLDVGTRVVDTFLHGPGHADCRGGHRHVHRRHFHDDRSAEPPTA